MGDECGSVTIERGALRRSVRNRYGPLFSRTRELVHSRRPEDSLEGFFEVGDLVAYVTRRVEEASKALVYDAVREWFSTQQSDANLLNEFEAEEFDPLVSQTLVKRAVASGSGDARRLLTRTFARSLGITLKRGPKAQSLYVQHEWIRKNLTRVESAVRSARQRDPDARDFAPLEQIIREFFPSALPASLLAQVCLCRRSHRAVELLVGRRIGVGPDKARQIIALIKHRPSKKRSGISPK